MKLSAASASATDPKVGVARTEAGIESAAAPSPTRLSSRRRSSTSSSRSSSFMFCGSWPPSSFDSTEPSFSVRRKRAEPNTFAGFCLAIWISYDESSYRPQVSDGRTDPRSASVLRSVLQQDLSDDPVASVHDLERLRKAVDGKAMGDDGVELEQALLEEPDEARPRPGRVGEAAEHLHVAEHDPVGGHRERLVLSSDPDHDATAPST